MYELFCRQLDARADREAVRDGHGSLTYAELFRRANLLAAALGQLPPGSRIGLQLGRTKDLIVAILGILAAGHTYVPLDPAYPVGRLQFMTVDSGLTVVLS